MFRRSGFRCTASCAGWATHERGRPRFDAWLLCPAHREGYLADVRLRDGPFRAFLLTSFRHFVSKERDRARALKRGGGHAPLSIDAAEAEGLYADQPLDALDPNALRAVGPSRFWSLQWLVSATGGLGVGVHTRRSRTDFHLPDELSLLGFKTVDGFEPRRASRHRRLSHPDSFDTLHTVTVQAGPETVDLLPVFQSLLYLGSRFQSFGIR